MWRLSILKMLTLVACVLASNRNTQETIIEGHRGYTSMHLGNINILISVPHGGTVAPDDMPDNFNSSSEGDSSTRLVAKLVRQELSQLFGSCNDNSQALPFLIINNLARSKMDPNEDGCECDEPSLDSMIAQADYHRLINENFERDFMSCTKYEQGLLVDVQSHDNPEAFYELGYLVTPTEENTDFQSSSIRLAASLSDLSFSELLNGLNSLGGILQYKYNIRAMPSPKYNTSVNETGYNSGGFVIKSHGSRECSQHRVNAIQIRIPTQALVGPWMNLRITSKIVAGAVYDFYRLHYFDQVIDQYTGKCI